MTVKLREIFFAFVRAGALGFGGGAALAPVIHRECVSKKEWVSDEKFNDILAVSNVLPGPSAIEMATAIGWEKRGLAGALAASTGLVVPFGLFSVAFVLTVFGYLQAYPEEVIWFKKASVGLFVFVAVMTALLSVRLVKAFAKERSYGTAIWLSALIFIVVDDNFWFGGQLPFQINNSFVILVMIALVILHESPWSRRIKLFCIIPPTLFLWSLSSLFPNVLAPHVFSISIVLFIITALISWVAFKSVKMPKAEHPHRKRSMKFWHGIIRGQLKLWGASIGIYGLMSLLCSPLRAAVFLKMVWNTIFASLMTFGGGPVYIPLAISMLSGEDSPIFLYSRERMMQIVALTNPIPSPIMTKISAVSGYDIVQDMIYNVIPGNGVPQITVPPLFPAVEPWIGSMIMVAVMTIPAITAMMFAWPAIDKIKASPSLKDTAVWIKPILVAVFTSVAVMFLESGWEMFTEPVTQQGIGCSGAMTLFHLSFLAVFFFLMMSKKYISDFWLMLVAIAWGLLLT